MSRESDKKLYKYKYSFLAYILRKKTQQNIHKKINTKRKSIRILKKK